MMKNNNGFSLSTENVLFDFLCEKNVSDDNDLCKIKILGDVPVPELKADDRLLLPVDEGIAITVGQKYEKGELDINYINTPFCRREGTISMIIIERNKNYLLIALDSGLHASYSAIREDEGYRLKIQCETEHEITYGIYPSLVQACNAYKEIKKINPVKLSEKIKKNPEIKKMIGGGIFWVWNDHYNEVMYADHDTEVSPAVGEKLLTVAERLYSKGVKNAMFGLFFDEDSVYSKELYQKYGYLPTQYDNYNDVLNPQLLTLIPQNRYKNCGYTKRRTIDYPQGIQIDKDKKMMPAWALMGFDGKYHDQNTLCPLVAAERIKEEVPRIISQYPDYKGRFIDVYGGGVSECFSEEHPLTIEECLEVKKEAFDFLSEIGLIAGTEDGFEDLADSIIYAEGLHSPVYFRINDAGRNHAVMYNNEQREHIEKYMLNPECRVPLWQLIYHDSVMAFPYWGDSTDDCIPQVKQKILYACLFGCPPLYSFMTKNFSLLEESILLSYEKISKVHEKVALLPMTDYEVITSDYQVQKTVFGEKYEIIANFSKNDFIYDGIKIQAEDFIVREK